MQDNDYDYNQEYNTEQSTMTNHQSRERQSVFKGAPLSIYKQTGAAQFKLIIPSQSGQRKINSAGSILLEMAKCLGKKGKNNSYDWKNKIIVKLMPIEISRLSQALAKQEEVSFIHNVSFGTGQDSNTKGDVYKKINLNKGQKPGTMFLTTNFQSKNVSVPLNRDEMILLATLLRSVLPIVYGWT